VALITSKDTSQGKRAKAVWSKGMARRGLLVGKGECNSKANCKVVGFCQTMVSRGWATDDNNEGAGAAGEDFTFAARSVMMMLHERYECWRHVTSVTLSVERSRRRERD
jgi:hypothetical protein